MRIFTLIIIQLLLFSLILDAQNEYDNHILNDPVYRDIFKHNLKVSDQNIDDAIVIDNFLVTLQKTKGTSLKLNPYTSIDLPSQSPEELIRSYAYKMSELEAVCNNIRTEIDMRLDTDIDNAVRIAERELKKYDVSIGNSVYAQVGKEMGKKALKNKILKKKEEQIAEAKREAERDLQYQLESKLRPVRDQMLRENKEWIKQSIYAAAYAPELSEEKEYLNAYAQYKCCFDYVNSNYSYQNTRWLNPPCKSSDNVDYQSENTSGFDYTKVAMRKYNLYEKYRDKNFLDATLMYLNYGLEEDPRNADLFVLKYNLEDDIVEKYHAIKIANYLAMNNIDIEYKYESYYKTYTNELKSSIDNRDTDFINRSLEKQLISNIKIEKMSPLEYCIKTDNADMMDLFIQHYKLTQKELNYLQVPIIMFGAGQCFGFLNSNYDIDNTLLIREKNNMTLLNLSLLNDKENIAEKLVTNKNVLNSLIYASKYISNEELDNLCDFLYDNNNSYLSQIKRYNSTFNPTAYRIQIEVPNFETADIYYNKERIGTGSAVIGIRKLDQLEDIQIIGNVKYKEELNANYLKDYLQKGENKLLINLIDEPEELISYEQNFNGKLPYHSFYKQPILLKEYKTTGIGKGFAWLGGALATGGLTYIAFADGSGEGIAGGVIAGLFTISFTAQGFISFFNPSTKKIYSNINENKKRAEYATNEAKNNAYNYNKPILEEINKLISERNDSLLNERKIILLDKNGEQQDITPQIDDSLFKEEKDNSNVIIEEISVEKDIENTTISKNNYSNYPKLILFKGIDNITTGISTYNHITNKFGLPYAVQNSSDNNKHVIYKDIGVKFIFMHNSRRLSYVTIEETFKGISKEGIKIGMNKMRIQKIMEKSNYIKSGKNVDFNDEWTNSEGKQVSFWWNSDNTLKKIIIY